MPYRRNRKTGGTFFIATAIKRPGALRNYIANTYGPAGFTKRGTIKVKLLQDLADGTCPICLEGTDKCVCPSDQTRKRARFAKMLRELRK